MDHGSCEHQGSCYIWCDSDPKLFAQVTDSIKQCRLCNAELPVLHLSANSGLVLKTSSLLGFVLHFCRKNKLLQNDFTSFLCSKDHQLAMQLCAARNNKKENGEFSVDASNISSYISRYAVMCIEESDHKISEECQVLQEYLDFLKFSNSIDEWQLICLFKKACKSNNSFKAFFDRHTMLITGTPTNLTSMKILEFLTENRKSFKIQVEVPLNASFHEEVNNSNINITIEEFSLQHISVVEPTFSHVSATEECVREVLIAFLRLLVNSRDEMALAYVLTSPIIEMNHAAFTDLKRCSSEKGMPMYQTAISYVMQVKLGKKSYTTSSDCLLQHLKGLSLLVDFMQHLQTILEDDPCPMSSFKKIVKIIKNRLLKKKCFRSESVENAAERVIQLITSFHCKYKEVDWHNLNLDADETLKLSSLKATRFLCWIVDYLSTQYEYGDMHGIFSTSCGQGTPLNLPSIFSYFRSPLEMDGVEKEVGSKTHEEISESSKQDLTFNKKMFNVECSAEKHNPSVPQGQTPILKNRTKAQENIENAMDKEIAVKKTKRCIFGELSNLPKKRAIKTKKPTRTKKAKDPPKGQTNITNYFILR